MTTLWKNLLWMILCFGLASCQIPPPPKPKPLSVKKPKGSTEKKVETFLWGRVFTKKNVVLAEGPKGIRGWDLFKNNLMLWGSKEVFFLNLKLKKIKNTLSFPRGITDGSSSQKGTALGLAGQHALVITLGGSREALPFSANHVAFQPQGNFLAYSPSPNSVILYSLYRKKEAQRFPVKNARGLFFSPRGKWLAVLEDKALTLWNGESWAKKTSLSQSIFAFGPRDSEMVFYRQGKLERWDIYSEENLKSRSTPPLLSLAYSPLGSLVGGLSKDGKIYLWSGSDLQPVCTIQSEVPLKFFFFSPLGYSIYAIGKDGQVLNWPLAKGDFSLNYLEYFKQKEAVFQYEQGEKALQDGQIQEAVRHWKQALGFDPNYQTAKARLGEHQKGEFEKVYQASQTKIQTYLKRGEIQKALGEYDYLLRFETLDYRPLEEILEEVGLLKKALDQYQMGEKFYRAKKSVQAYPHYRRAIQYDPSLELARQREQALWGSYYASLPKEKKTVFLAVRKKKLPPTPKKNKLLAKLKTPIHSTPPTVKNPPVKRVQPVPPVKPIKKVPVKKAPVKKAPTPRELFQRAEKYKNQSRFGEALSFYRQVDSQPKFARPAILAMAEIFYSQKKYSQAIDQFQRAQPISPLKKTNLLKLAECYLKEKEKKKALLTFQKIVPSEKGLTLKIFLLAKELGDLQRAYQAVSSLIQGEPATLKWRKGRYQLAKKLDQPSLLSALVEDLEYLAREKNSYLMELGELYQKQGKVSMAKKTYIKGFQRCGSHRKKGFTTKLEGLGYIYSQSQWMKGEDYYRREGLVKWGTEWVSPLKKRLLQKIIALSSPPHRPAKAKTDQALAEKRLIPGMNRRELVEVMGFWQRVAVVYRQDESYEVVYFAKKNRYVYLWKDLVVGVE